MAFGRLERREAPKPMGEINMTPLIDVMLVLLVIFMISAPLMSNSLRLDLPASAAATPSEASEFLAVSMSADGRLHLGEDMLSTSEFQTRVQALGKTHPNTEVQLRADKAVPYGQVAELIGWIQAAGLNRIAFVTEAAAPKTTIPP